MRLIGTSFDDISNAVMIFGSAMIALRLLSIRLLKRSALYDALGKPRQFFFSDLLPFRLLRLKATRLRYVERLVFALYAGTYVGFLGASLLMIVSLSLRTAG
ncbi:hypothetical protein LUTEI9C_80169 [Luteimonas sp. 9C]|uniref:hypothetical protein n=1 Tax=Luteimonas sp. 9C TaxID=2653148 RepID=UPI0012F07135|nr:hypothetical protein [Luteimonas sp. 9C]VXC14035.1 hypothetical protein LUTEI9C_80169 [Luteimonas sp. 9C]